MNRNQYSFIFSPVSFSFLTFSYHWFSTRNSTTCNKCVCVFAYFVLLVWSCLLFYLSEKRMNGWREMTGDSSNIGCLEALAVPSTNNSAQSAPKSTYPCWTVYKRLYTLVYTKAQYTPVYSLYIKQQQQRHVLQSGRQAVAYHRGTCHSTCSSSITDREGAFSINVLFVFLFLIIIVIPMNRCC